jgi:hypothetical protein
MISRTKFPLFLSEAANRSAEAQKIILPQRAENEWQRKTNSYTVTEQLLLLLQELIFSEYSSDESINLSEVAVLYHCRRAYWPLMPKSALVPPSSSAQGIDDIGVLLRIQDLDFLRLL